MLLEQEKLEDAEQVLQQTMSLKEKALGRNHPQTLCARRDHFRTLTHLKRFEEAGKEHPNTLASMNNLAITLAERSKHDEALVLMEACFALSARVLGVDNPETKWRGEFVRTGGPAHDSRRDRWP